VVENYNVVYAESIQGVKLMTIYQKWANKNIELFSHWYPVFIFKNLKNTSFPNKNDKSTTRYLVNGS
jgi:hypothetical protein